jgi:hypothetical protein
VIFIIYKVPLHQLFSTGTRSQPARGSIDDYWGRYGSMTVDPYIINNLLQHNWGAKLKTHYTAHLAAALSNFVMIEGVPDQTKGIQDG